MSSLLHEALYALVIFLPAGMANMSPIFAGRMPILKNWDTPIDLGRTYKGKRLLGANKRWRGLAFGTLVGTITALIEYAIASHFWTLSQSAAIVAVAGGLMGFGALAGDAVESFFKRQANVKPGHSWFPFDQIDYIIGGLLVSYPVVKWPISDALAILVIYFGLHLLASYIGYLMGLKERPI